MTGNFRYPVRSLVAAYARSAFGLVFSLGPLVFVRPAPAAAWVLAAAATLFLVYFARTVCRHFTHIELDETGIRATGPLGAALRWEDLRSMRLDYYSTRSDREGGWMQLKLRDARRTIRIDSEIDGFAELARGVAAEALRRDVGLDESTRANFAMLGIAAAAADAG